MKLKSLVYFLLLTLFGCQSTTNKAQNNTIGNQMKYAQHVVIQSADGYDQLHILNPKTHQIETRFALVKAGSTATIPSNYTKIEVPVKHLVALSSTYIGMLDAINGLDFIVGTTNKDYIFNPKVLRKIESGKIVDFGDESSITPEKLVQQKAELILYSGFGQPFPNADKLMKLNILTLSNYDWEEAHPLGKAEWIKVFGALCGKQKEANDYFSSVVKHYNLIKKKAGKSNLHPRVIFGGMVGSIWYTPAGKSFLAGVMKDAGFDYCYSNEKGTASCEKSLEQIFKDQKGILLWLNAEASSMSELSSRNKKFETFDAYKSGKIYTYIPKSNFFWEYSAVNPHWMLEDFAVIAGTIPKKPLHFYSQLSE